MFPAFENADPLLDRELQVMANRFEKKVGSRHATHCAERQTYCGLIGPAQLRQHTFLVARLLSATSLSRGCGQLGRGVLQVYAIRPYSSL